MNTIDDIRARLEKQRMVTPDDIEEVLNWLQIIQEAADPVRYAVSHLQYGTEKDAIISAGEGYMYADEDDRELRVPDLTKLMFRIFYGGEPA